MALTRILFRRADTFTSRECDIAEPFYDGNIGTLGVGDGTTTPPRMLTEHKNQTMTNKIIDAEQNTLLHIDPVRDFAEAQFSVAPLQGVVSSFPITGSLSVVSPTLDSTAVNALNTNINELRVKINEIISLLQKVNLSQ
jgi:hypothetical protein